MTANGMTNLDVLLLAAVASGCTATSGPPAEPAWLQARISQFSHLPAANPPRAVLRTIYAGRTVYFVTPTCCDIPSELYEESGQLICFPSGGFAGGDGRCRDFTLSPNSATVWRDTRAPTRDAPASGRN